MSQVAVQDPSAKALGAVVAPAEVLLEADDVEEIPWHPFAGHDGVAEKVLWTDPRSSSYAGMLALAPGATLRLHRHRGAAHHLTVVRGSCRVGGVRLRRGSYTYVPAGCWHGISEAGQAGCQLFFLHLEERSASHGAHG